MIPLVYLSFESFLKTNKYTTFLETFHVGVTVVNVINEKNLTKI